MIAQVLQWKIMNTGDNLLAAALKLGYEDLAFQQAPEYLEVFTYEFFMWCIAHCKETFLKKALTEQYFSLDLVNQEDTITYLI